MTNFHTATPRRALSRHYRAAGLATAALVSLTLWFSSGGCQQRAGMPCQQQSDCTPGLLCNKPPNAGPQGYGLCEPGLKGLGEHCINSAECSLGLICSTDVGMPSADGWHGACQTGSLADAAVTIDGASADLGTRPD